MGYMSKIMPLEERLNYYQIAREKSVLSFDNGENFWEAGQMSRREYGMGTIPISTMPTNLKTPYSNQGLERLEVSLSGMKGLNKNEVIREGHKDRGNFLEQTC